MQVRSLGWVVWLVLWVVGAVSPIRAQENDAPPPPLVDSELALFRAAEAGDRAAAQTALGQGARVDALAANGASPLMRAAFAAHTEMVRFLLEAGASPARRNREGMTVLFIAVLEAYYPTPEHKDAARAAKREIVQLLLRQGANARTPDLYRQTPLIKAAAQGHPEMARALLEAGASPSERDDNGNTPLLRTYDLETARVLLSRRDANGRPIAVNVADVYGQTPLVRATSDYRFQYTDQPAFVRLLIEAGASPDARDVSGATPLFYAAEYGRADVATVLLAAGANPNLANRERITPLMKACVTINVFGKTEEKKARRQALVQLLLDKGADVRLRDAQGNSVAHYAAVSRDVELLKTLRAHGVDLRVKSRAGVTTLHVAASDPDPDMIAYLIAEGLDVNAQAYPPPQGNRETPLLVALYNPTGTQLPTCRQLLEAGANPNLRDGDGRTALHHVASGGRADLVSLLLEFGAEVDVRTPDGSTPLLLAVESERYSTARALLEAGADPQARRNDGSNSLTLQRQAAERLPAPEPGRPVADNIKRTLALLEMLEAAAKGEPLPPKQDLKGW